METKIKQNYNLHFQFNGVNYIAEECPTQILVTQSKFKKTKKMTNTKKELNEVSAFVRFAITSNALLYKKAFLPDLLIRINYLINKNRLHLIQ